MRGDFAPTRGGDTWRCLETSMMEEGMLLGPSDGRPEILLNFLVHRTGPQQRNIWP